MTDMRKAKRMGFPPRIVPLTILPSSAVDNPGGPVLPSGEQLYELVRDQDGDGWAVQEARIPSVLPAWQNITFTPWYR
jgi:hypothetical protein